MTVEELLARLREDTGLDMTEAWDGYSDGVESLDADGFLQHLRERGLINRRTFRELHGQGDVEVTQVIDRDFDVTRILDIHATTVVIASPSPASASCAHGSPAEHPAPAGGTREGGASGSWPPPRYQLVGLLGEGAMGEVHLARDLGLRRKVAYKKALPALAADPAQLNRFFTEAQITSQLDHPQIVPIYGLEVAPDGTLAYAMKLVQGRELAELVDETRGSYERGDPIDDGHGLERRLEVFVRVCDAIAFAHSKGIVHRDLKPANIMVGRFNEVYVMDWGIARLMAADAAGADEQVELAERDGSPVATDRTQLGTAVGTPIYMSPEQAAGKNAELDGRSDLYTLGLILMELVTLRPARRSGTLLEVMRRAMAGEREPVRHLHASGAVPRELEAIIEKATRREPDERYATVGELADDVRRFLRGDAVEARPDTFLQKVGRWIGKHRGAALGVFATTFALALGAAATIGTMVYDRGLLEQASLHEQVLGEFVAAAGVRGQDIDLEFQRYESELERLAGSAEMVLSHAAPEDAPLHLAGDFTPGPAAPGDLEDSSYYGRPVSFDALAYELAPGVRRADVAASMGKLLWLRPTLRRVIVDSYHQDAYALSLADQRRIVLHEATAIHRAFISLPDGVHARYPGMASHVEKFDGRRQSYYAATLGSVGIVWGDPYAEPGGAGLAVPASVSLRGPAGELLGVAGFEITLAHIVEEMLDIRELPYPEESMLVDADGRVVAHSRPRDDDLAAGPALGPSGIELQSFPFPDALERFRTDRAGFLEIEGDRDWIIAFDPVESVGWTYVVIADMQRMLSSVSTDK